MMFEKYKTLPILCLIFGIASCNMAENSNVQGINSQTTISSSEQSNKESITSSSNSNSSIVVSSSSTINNHESTSSSNDSTTNSSNQSSSNSSSSSESSSSSSSSESSAEVISPVETEVRKIYSLAMMFRFKDEPETINDDTFKILDNTYNNSIYSVKEYYKGVSNNKVELETLYLCPDGKKFSSMVIDRYRGEYYEYHSINNPEGYKYGGTSNAYGLQSNWLSAANEAIKNGAKVVNGNGEVVETKLLDENKDNKIDSMTVMFTEDPKANDRHLDSNNALWAYRWGTKGGYLTLDGMHGFDYYQWTPTLSTTYQEINNPNMKIVGTIGNTVGYLGTAIHETGHIFGLYDLYDTFPSANYLNSPAGRTSLMSYPTKTGQFLSAYERHSLKWITDENIKEAELNKELTVSVSKPQDQKDIVAYKYKIPNFDNFYLYIEYRNSEDGDNIFDLKNKNLLYTGSTSNVLVEGLGKGILAYVINEKNDYSSIINYERTAKNMFWDYQVVRNSDLNPPYLLESNTSQNINIIHSNKKVYETGLMIQTLTYTKDSAAFRIIKK